MITVRAGGPAHLGGRVLAVVFCAVIALGIPQYYPAFRVDQFSEALAIAVAALGLNLLIGYAGMLSVGHSAFFGIGAYATSLLTDPEVGWSHWQAAAAGVGIAFVAGLLCGLPALRIKGHLPGAGHPGAGRCLPSTAGPLHRHHRRFAGQPVTTGATTAWARTRSDSPRTSTATTSRW
jgi:hypothetical protein